VLPAWQLLSPEERTRQAAFRQEIDRRQYLLAHTMKRIALSRALGVPAGALRFAADARGKPHLTTPARPIGFSLSHGGAAAAVAVAMTSELGVDIEALDRPVRPETMQAVMGDAEGAAIRALPAPRRVEAALRLWTAREAVMKALGLGLAMSRTAVAFRLTPSGPEVARVDPGIGPAGAWHLLARDVAGGRVLACAVRHDGPVVWHVSSLDDALAGIADWRGA
jgi:4'-phosphopantetheinyl transferase